MGVKFCVEAPKQAPQNGRAGHRMDNGFAGRLWRPLKREEACPKEYASADVVDFRVRDMGVPAHGTRRRIGFGSPTPSRQRREQSPADHVADGQSSCRGGSRTAGSQVFPARFRLCPPTAARHAESSSDSPGRHFPQNAVHSFSQPEWREPGEIRKKIPPSKKRYPQDWRAITRVRLHEVVDEWVGE